MCQPHRRFHPYYPQYLLQPWVVKRPVSHYQVCTSIDILACFVSLYDDSGMKPNPLWMGEVDIVRAISATLRSPASRLSSSAD
jgi:hypothetical protein